jgi:hypothetical protein
MKKVLLCSLGVYLIVHPAIANTGKPGNTPIQPIRYAKVGFHFNTFRNYFQQRSIKMLTGIDSADVFNKIKNGDKGYNFYDFYNVPNGTYGTSPTYAYNAGYTYDASAITGLYFGNLFNSNNSTSLQFRVRNSAGTSTNVLTILGDASATFAGSVTGDAASFSTGIFSGNVGIGTTSPGTTLDVRATTASQQLVSTNTGNVVYTAYRNETSNNGYLYIGKEGSTGGSIITGTTAYSGVIGLYGSTAPLQFATNNAVAITILNDGKVGIGTTAPDAPLVVNASSSNGSGRIAFKTEGTRFGSIGTGHWALGDGTSDMTLLSDGAMKFATNNATGVKMVIATGGNIGIGTASPAEKLSVNGNISAKKLIVTQTGWSDYVFNKDYKLRSLQSLETFINQYNHLPEVPTAKEAQEKGISVGDNQALLLKKIEELTLYVIELKKESQNQQKQINGQKKEIRQLKYKIYK